MPWASVARRPRIGERKMPDPEGVTVSGFVRTFQGRESILRFSVGVAQRSPTAINLDPSGMMRRDLKALPLTGGATWRQADSNEVLTFAQNAQQWRGLTQE